MSSKFLAKIDSKLLKTIQAPLIYSNFLTALNMHKNFKYVYADRVKLLLQIIKIVMETSHVPEIDDQEGERAISLVFFPSLTQNICIS